MIVAIGKHHGHYQIERNMVIVKKKTHEKKKESQGKFKKNETERRKIKQGKYFIRRKHYTQFYLQKFEKNSKINYLGLKGERNR
jgi:hypothetical protein